MKSISKILQVSIVALSITACSDFLDVEPQNKALLNTYYSTEQEVFYGLVAAYDPMQWSYVEGKWTSTVMLGEIWSDNANAGGDATNFDQPGWQEIDDLLATTVTPEVGTFWIKGYSGINKCNQLLNNIKFSSPLVEQYIAEAKFLRAFYHFELFRMYGPIPVFTSIPLPDDKSIKRNTLTEVFTQIETDLKEAIPNLPESYSAEYAGRVTQGAAEALLGKAYLYWADLKNDDVDLFDKAATHLNNVITSGNYSLLDDYQTLYAFGAANTSESVFEIQHTNQVPAGWNSPYPLIEGNLIVQLCGIRSLCSGHPTYIDGWGFMLPTTNLVNSYLSDDVYRQGATIISVSEIVLSGCSDPTEAQNPIDFEGYWQQKYANYKSYTAPDGEINILKDANQPYIRYADVLLMYAEALVRGNGSDIDAMAAIDLVRERAKGPGDNTGNFRKTETVMAEEGLSLLDVIWYERRAELAGEGDRWFDLVRSGRAKAELFDIGNLRRNNFSMEDLYLPIPQHDIDFTGGGLTPYPNESLFE